MVPLLFMPMFHGLHEGTFGAFSKGPKSLFVPKLRGLGRYTYEAVC